MRFQWGGGGFDFRGAPGFGHGRRSAGVLAYRPEPHAVVPPAPRLETLRGSVRPYLPSLRLAMAVLDDALETIVARNEAYPRRWSDAVEWVDSDDRTDLFAFLTICELLDIDADRVRRRLRAWVEVEGGGASELGRAPSASGRGRPESAA